jgi:uncharacterized protein (TIGR02453 family)
MIPQSTFKFLKALRENNNRDWFQKHKNEYETAKNNFEDFVNKLISGISAFDSGVRGLEAKKCVFRIYRDVRFSHDKSPYKTNFGAGINPGGKKSMKAGYYFHVESGASFIGGGIYMPPSPELNAVRLAIYNHPKEFKKIIHKKSFVDSFGELWGEKLKTSPKDFPKDFVDIDLLRYKSYIVGQDHIKDKEMLSPDLLKNSIRLCKEIYPFLNFINRAI